LCKITPEKYKENIDKLELFLRGKTTEVSAKLESEMKLSASNQEFETAAEIRDTINLIDEVTHQKKRLKPELTTPGLMAQLSSDGTIYLQDILAENLRRARQTPLKRIECFDVSNIGGKNAAVAMVTFIDGKSDHSEYRLFNIRSIDTPNDYQMLREAIARRQNHPEWGKPDLIIIDGGKGQVRAALSVWTWDIPVIGIAKDPDRLVIPLLEFNGRPQKVTQKSVINYQMLKLPTNHPGLKLVQQLRDEAHRFSKKQHSRLRVKNMLQSK
jgi:excinuclease ABC subunit C